MRKTIHSFPAHARTFFRKLSSDRIIF